MRETEITVQVHGDVNDIKKTIEELSFKCVRHVVMADSYFSKVSMEQLKELPYQEIMRSSILVRKFEGDTNKVLLHYKDKQYDEEGNVLTEEKYTEPLSSAENVIKMFNQAGFTNWCNIVQDMYIYKNQNMEFALQLVDGLGAFIEYEEDESVAGLEPKEKVQIMVQKLKSFGLSLGEDYSVKKAYKKFLSEVKHEEQMN